MIWLHYTREQTGPVCSRIEMRSWTGSVGAAVQQNITTNDSETWQISNVHNCRLQENNENW